MPAEIRMAAATSLAKLGRRDGDFIAREYLGSDDPVIRSQAVILLGELRQPALLTELASRMRDDPNPLVQTAAAAAIVAATNPGTGIR